METLKHLISTYWPLALAITILLVVVVVAWNYYQAYKLKSIEYPVKHIRDAKGKCTITGYIKDGLAHATSVFSNIDCDYYVFKIYDQYRVVGPASQQPSYETVNLIVQESTRGFVLIQDGDSIYIDASDKSLEKGLFAPVIKDRQVDPSDPVIQAILGQVINPQSTPNRVFEGRYITEWAVPAGLKVTVTGEYSGENVQPTFYPDAIHLDQ